jgi:polyribonucleotide nucleotidyltransferase
VAEHRIGDIRDELKEGDQVLVKVLAVEGNRIRLSRKAILKEQRAKMGGGGGPEGAAAPEMGSGDGDVSAAPQHERAPMTGALVIEGGGDFPDEAENEPNFNRDGAPIHAGGSDRPRGDRPPGGDRGGRGGRPGGGGRDRGRGGRGGRPGGGGRDRGGRGGPGGGRH